MPIPGVNKGIEIKCRRCGKAARAEDFTVDYVYKMAVCPSCVKERKAKDVKSPVAEKNDAFGKPAESPKKEVAPKPAGWDEDDERLEKMARQKAKADNVASPQTYQQAQPQSTMAKTASLFGFASKSSANTGPTQKPQPTVQPKMQSPTQSAPQMQTSQSKPVNVMPKDVPRKAEAQNADPSKIRHKCRKCNFEFWYNTERKMPKACPYCNTGVDSIIFGKMN